MAWTNEAPSKLTTLVREKNTDVFQSRVLQQRMILVVSCKKISQPLRSSLN